MGVVPGGQGWHSEILRFLHQGVDLIGPVEQTILGVEVKVDELGRHAGFLLSPAKSIRVNSNREVKFQSLIAAKMASTLSRYLVICSSSVERFNPSGIRSSHSFREAGR